MMAATLVTMRAAIAAIAACLLASHALASNVVFILTDDQ
jgi:hypothetical protein